MFGGEGAGEADLVVGLCDEATLGLEVRLLDLQTVLQITDRLLVLLCKIIKRLKIILITTRTTL